MSIALMLLLAVTAFGTITIIAVSRKVTAEAKALRSEIQAFGEVAPAVTRITASAATTRDTLERLRRH